IDDHSMGEETSKEKSSASKPGFRDAKPIALFTRCPPKVKYRIPSVDRSNGICSGEQHFRILSQNRLICCFRSPANNPSSPSGEWIIFQVRSATNASIWGPSPLYKKSKA